MTKEERKEYDRQYYLKHRRRIIEKRKQYYEDNKGEVIKRVGQYRQDHRNTDFYCGMLEQHQYKTEIRHKALDLYGGKCENCGATKLLEFHHSNFDGENERKIYSSTKMYKSLADGNKRSDLRLLCRSCHHKIHNLRSSI